MINDDKFLEPEVFGNKYGTLKQPIIINLIREGHSFDIDWQGFKN